MRLFLCALWSTAGKGLTSWLSFVMSAVSLSLSHWYPGSGVVLDCIFPDLCTLTNFETVFEDVYSKLKRLKIVSETKCFELFSNDFS